ncbi:MAG: aminopeptidase P family protein [bacterium]|nr:aminopeptidase P family protein [bacterium]
MERSNLIRKHIFSSPYPPDAVLITHPNNIRYATGFTGSSAFVLLTPVRKYFFTDHRYETQSRSQVAGDYNFVFYQARVIREISKIIKRNRIRQLGMELEQVSFSFVNNLRKEACVRVLDISFEIMKMRSLKSRDEVLLLKKALRIAENAYSRIRSLVKPGVREDRIALELECRMREMGAEDKSFPTIVASGRNSAMPHAAVSRKNIKGNELVILDFGARYNGYHSDITQTLKISNKNKLLEKAYQTVRECVDMAREYIRPGCSTREAARQADAHIRKSGFQDGLIHSLGHGLGLDIHERPNISLNKDDEFREGMVFTIEPGIYLPGIGGVRIEKTACLSGKDLVLWNRI